jgi:hypothetical protein
MTLEALMVHHLDNMDSKLQGFLDALARERESDSNWAAPGFVFKRPLYKKTQVDMGMAQSPEAIKKPKPSPVAVAEKKPPKKEIPGKGPRPSEPLKTNLGSLLPENFQKKLKS